MSEQKLNKQGNLRGLHGRQGTRTNRKKVSGPSMDRAVAQYKRSCDGRVGRWVRVNETDYYNEVLEKADTEEKK